MRLFAQQPPSADQLPSADQVSRILREILADPDFATFAPPLRQQAIEWAFETISRAWRWLRRLMGEDGAGAAEIVVVVVALAALVVMATVASRHAPKWTGQEAKDDGEDAARAPATARDWLGTADRRAGRGEYRPAATALYEGFLLSLEQQGTLAFHASKTPGDYALEMSRGDAGSSAGAEAGGRFLNSFQDYSFGQEEPGPTGYASLARLARDAGCPAEIPESEACDR